MNLGDSNFENVSETIFDMLSPSFSQTIQHRILAGGTNLEIMMKGETLKRRK